MSLNRSLLASLLCLPMAVGGCHSISHQPVDDDQLNSESLAVQIKNYQTEGLLLGDPIAGEKLFNLVCTSCHSYTKEAELSSLFILEEGGDQSAANGTDQSGLLQEFSTAHLQATIQHGRTTPARAHSMPAWKHVLSQKEINDLVAFLVQIQSKYPDHSLP